MNTRKKLIVSLSILSLTIVAAIVSIVGVFALINTNINFGGNITFSATNIYATVSEGIINDGTISNDGKMQAITYDADNDGSATVTTWSNLNLSFPENGDDVVIKFNITNHSTQDKLRLTIGDITGTCNNATMGVVITEGKTGVTTMIPDEEVGTTSAVIEKAVAGTPATEYSAEVVITFHVTNRNYDASITNFSIPINLTKFDGYYVSLTYADDVMYQHGDQTSPWDGTVYVWTDVDDTRVEVGPAGQKIYNTKCETLTIESMKLTLTDNYGNTITLEQRYLGGEDIEITRDMVLTITRLKFVFQTGGSAD